MLQIPHHTDAQFPLYYVSNRRKNILKRNCFSWTAFTLADEKQILLYKRTIFTYGKLYKIIVLKTYKQVWVRPAFLLSIANVPENFGTNLGNTFPAKLLKHVSKEWGGGSGGKLYMNRRPWLMKWQATNFRFCIQDTIITDCWNSCNI